MYNCSNCGNESLTWKGQCDFCKEWNTLKEFREVKEKKWSKKWVSQELTKLDGKHIDEEVRIKTKSFELNTVLWGGIVPWSIILLSWEPGIGKSTLSLQLADWVDEDIIYISWEETLGQLRGRAKRLAVQWNNISLLTENNLENIFSSIEAISAKLTIWDSISVMQSDDISGSSGSVWQVRYITEKIVEYGKSRGIACIIIGHVTKDGSLAGPKTLEHMVDTVLYFEGDKYDNLRMLRCLKNRFGSTSEIGLYRMEEKWLSDITQPGQEFISNSEASSWLALGVTIEGQRALIIETEALTSYSKFGYPKRSWRGLPSSKLDLIIAVLGKYTPVKLESSDVYCNISRGLSVEEPGLDLALAVSIISSKLWKKVPRSAVFIGEISLTWKIKNVVFLEKRIKESLKLGFSEIYIPAGTKEKYQKELKISPWVLKEILHISDIIPLF